MSLSSMLAVKRKINEKRIELRVARARDREMDSKVRLTQTSQLARARHLAVARIRRGIP